MSKRLSRRSRRIQGTPRPRYVLIVLALSALAGSLVGASARPAAAAGTSAHFVRTCAAVPQGEMRCFALRRTTGVVTHVAAGMNPAVAVSGYGPSDLDSAYNVPDHARRGQDRRDRRRLRRPERRERPRHLPQQVRAAGVHDRPTAASARSTRTARRARCRRANAGWAAEIMLDIEMVSAICPNCHILLVEASSPTDREPRHRRQPGRRPGRGRRLEQLRRLRELERHELRQLVLQASRRRDHRLVRRRAATASSTRPPRRTSPRSAEPRSTRTSNARGWTESVWSTSSTEGAGSGCSAYEPKPSFQTDTGCARRTVADVSAVADPATGVAVYDSYGSGGWTVFGGTSVASPIIGAIYALANVAGAERLPELSTRTPIRARCTT